MKEVKGKDNVVFRRPPDAGILTPRNEIKWLYCDVNGVSYRCKGAGYKPDTDTWMIVGEEKLEA